MKWLISLFFFFTLLQPSNSALTLTKQAPREVNTELNGRIVDEAGNPLPHAHIRLISTSSGTSTDVNGFFRLRVAVSTPFEIEISAIGYLTTIETITLLPYPNATFTLSKLVQDIQQVEIRGIQPGSGNIQRVNPVHARALPSAAGPGIEGLIRSQMGVSSNNELSTQYRVRGGNFDENLVYVNGLEIYRPFLVHSGQQEGLSFVNPDMVESIEFSAGGFSAAFGDKKSSVLDITYKRPVAPGGGFSIGMLGASAHIEGSALDNNLTWVAGARYKTNRYMLGTLDQKGEYNPNFGDVQTFITYTLNPRWSFEFLGYYSLNSYEFIPRSRETSFGTLFEQRKLKIYFAGQENNRFETGFGAFSTNFKISERQRYRVTLAGFRTFEEVTYDILGAYWLQEIDNPLDREAEGTNIGVGQFLQHARHDLFGSVQSIDIEGTHSTARGITKWGARYRAEAFSNRINEWEMIDSAGYSIPYRGDRLELSHAQNAFHDIYNHRFSGFITNQSSLFINSGMLIMNIGLRGTWFSANREINISPRVLLTFLPSENSNSRLRLSGGLYFQPPFFKELRRPDGTLNLDLRAQRSLHLVSGYDHFFRVLERPFKFTTEVYFKAMDRLIPYHVDNVRIIYSGENEARGYAAGIDFKINGELVPGEESWATLSFMKTEENIQGDYWQTLGKPGEPGFIPRPSDQRVNFSMFLQDNLPRNPEFKVHLSMFYGSGLPFGPPRSARYTAINRFPPYRRVDIGFSVDLLQTSFIRNRDAFGLDNLWLGLEIFNLPNINNTISHYWVTDINNRQYAVPNYLTSRRLNLRLTGRF